MDNKNQKLDRNVKLTAITSFFTDVSSEMLYPLLQSFVSSVMKAQATFLGPILGIIEGVAESTASLLKLVSGYYSDKLSKRKMPTILGYATSMLSKLLYLIPMWLTILLSRFFDRVGKGIRSAPRDALISESTPKEMQGKAFGFQRAMDFAGAFLGTILCFLLIQFVFPDINSSPKPEDFLPIYALSLIPAMIGVGALFFIKEKNVETTPSNQEKPKPNLNIRGYDKNLKLFFLSQFIFTLGNSSNQFLLLRSTELGFTLSSVLVMYILFNLTTSLLSTLFGSLSDKIGRKRVLVMGYALYAIVYGAFGFLTPSHNFLLWGFWILYGLYYAMTEGVEKAFVSDIAEKQSKATVMGFYHTIVGIGLLPASIIAGFLFSLLPGLPFYFGSLMAVISLVILGFVKVQKSPQ